jgi:translation initiation factor 2B subunit (eIF-2B alpha/beta/delta family)
MSSRPETPLEIELVDTVEQGEELIVKAQAVSTSMRNRVRALLDNEASTSAEAKFNPDGQSGTVPGPA